MIKADLHLHTTYSDGDLTPGQIVALAGEKGYAQISVTDHDTMAGVEEAIAAGRANGVSVIPGIEITVRFSRSFFTGSLHLLTYFSESLMNDNAFVNQLTEAVSSGRGRALTETRVAMINREFGPRGTSPLLRHPLEVSSIEAISSNASRRHFAVALSTVHGLSREQVSMVIGNSSPAYVPSGVELNYLGPLFRDYPVVPVLAHPAAGSFPGESHYKEVLPPFSTVVRLLPEFLMAGLMGLEVHYPGHTPEHTEQLFSLAVSLGLVITGGSDCHDASERPMGAAGLTEPVDFQSLFRAMGG